MALYNVAENKISVIYEGYLDCHSGLDPESRAENRQGELGEILKQVGPVQILKQVQDDNLKYLLFIGRIEERKNIINIVKAFEILKEKYNIPHKLVLAGKPGYGYDQIKFEIRNSKFETEILELGYVREEEKWELLKNAACFVFPTFYEGFGIPVLEAQSVGCPVVTSNNSSLAEIVKNGAKLRFSESSSVGNDEYSALIVDPGSFHEIAEAVYKLISDEKLKNVIIAKGLENVKRFSWGKCAQEIAESILN
jgi:glycosyltransferase involved in cell wall biosynthesis